MLSSPNSLRVVCLVQPRMQLAFFCWLVFDFSGKGLGYIPERLLFSQAHPVLMHTVIPPWFPFVEIHVVPVNGSTTIWSINYMFPFYVLYEPPLFHQLGH